MKTIGIIALMGLMLVGCDDGAETRTAKLKLRLAEEGEAKAEKQLLKSQAEVRKHMIRISELELEIAEMKSELATERRNAAR